MIPVRPRGIRKARGGASTVRAALLALCLLPFAAHAKEERMTNESRDTDSVSVERLPAGFQTRTPDGLFARVDAGGKVVSAGRYQDGAPVGWRLERLDDPALARAERVETDRYADLEGETDFPAWVDGWLAEIVREVRSGAIEACSFCGKGRREVKRLIAGPKVSICDECVALCGEILREETAPK